jgi:glutaminyl-peptide cyclotransferase
MPIFVRLIFYMKRLFSALAIAALLAACNGNDGNGNNNGNEANSGNTTPGTTIAEPQNISYDVVNVYPHDTAAFTQGFEWFNNKLYESTGLKGQSNLRITSLKTGLPEKKKDIDPALFGEGITILNNKIYQLTWEDKKVFVYDLDFNKLQELSWNDEGWGITNNDTLLIVSTGSSNLYYVDPATFKIVKTLPVTSSYGPVDRLNELEYINGYVYANVFGESYIYKIDLATGHVVGKMDCSVLLPNYARENMNQPKYTSGEAVLNGIAYDSAAQRMFITGKLWPKLFEVKLK